MWQHAQSILSVEEGREFVGLLLIVLLFGLFLAAVGDVSEAARRVAQVFLGVICCTVLSFATYFQLFVVTDCSARVADSE
jgi:cytochrome c biogenesis factor